MEGYKILTAEEFAKEKFMEEESGYSFNNLNKIDQVQIKRVMIEFAKLHVTQALKVASENAQIETKRPNPYTDESYQRVKPDSILNAYPLEKIK